MPRKICAGCLRSSGEIALFGGAYWHEDCFRRAPVDARARAREEHRRAIDEAVSRRASPVHGTQDTPHSARAWSKAMMSGTIGQAYWILEHAPLHPEEEDQLCRLVDELERLVALWRPDAPPT